MITKNPLVEPQSFYIRFWQEMLLMLHYSVTKDQLPNIKYQLKFFIHAAIWKEREQPGLFYFWIATTNKKLLLTIGVSFGFSRYLNIKHLFMNKISIFDPQCFNWKTVPKSTAHWPPAVSVVSILIVNGVYIALSWVSCVWSIYSESEWAEKSGYIMPFGHQWSPLRYWIPTTHPIFSLCKNKRFSDPPTSIVRLMIRISHQT